MAYGRLDIFWPDGRIETVLLETPTVSVGRSSGCTIVLDTDTISRYHFSITHDSDQVTISDMDSANGTYVDGVILRADESRSLMGGEELQIGYLRMIYHAVDDQPTVAMADDETEETQHFERKDLGFKVEVSGPEIEVPPGAHTTIDIAITNLKSESRYFTVRASGLPEAWGRINRPDLRVSPHETALVLLSVKPLRQSDSKPGLYPITLMVALRDDDSSKVEAEVQISILPYNGFGMALGARTITAYDPIRLHVMNQGSVELPIYVAGRSQDDSLQITIREPQVTLAPGERRLIQGEVVPSRRRWFGPVRALPFDLLVRSGDEAAFLAAERGRYMEAPVLPRWATYTLALGAVAAAALLIFAIYLLLQPVPPDPQITGFEVSQSQLAQGEPLVVNWTVADTDTIAIWVDGGPVLTGLPADQTSAEIETGTYAGDITIELRAFRDEDMVSRSLPVNVYIPLEFIDFVVSPPVLYRHVVQPLTIIWETRGTDEVRILGLDRIYVGEEALPQDYVPAGQITVPVLPDAIFTVYLSAENALGETQERPFPMNLADSECTIDAAVFDTLPLYVTEGLAFRPVDDAQTLLGQTLIVDGRTMTGPVWVRGRLQRPDGETVWWPSVGLNCEGFDPANLRRVEETVPQIAPSPTPTLTPTITPTSTPAATPTTTPSATLSTTP
jgi:hypothetical protein